MHTIFQKLAQRVVSSLLLLKFVKRYRTKTSLMKIKAAQLYVSGVDKARILFVGGLLIAVSFVLLISGLFLIQSAFFTYSMWTNEMKFVVALVLGGIEFLGAIGIFIYLSREETWGKFFKIQQVVDSILNEKEKNNKK